MPQSDLHRKSQIRDAGHNVLRPKTFHYRLLPIKTTLIVIHPHKSYVVNRYNEG